jgi:hypothetical protein
VKRLAAQLVGTFKEITLVEIASAPIKIWYLFLISLMMAHS